MRLTAILLLLAAASTTRAQLSIPIPKSGERNAHILENFACSSPASISNSNPAVVTCRGAHGFDQRATAAWNFNGPNALPSDGGWISIDGVRYTFVSSLDNGVPNQVLIGAAPVGNTAKNLQHAVNDDGIGKGTLYSSATTANPTFSAAVIDNPLYGYCFFTARSTGSSSSGRPTARSTSPNANGAWSTTATVIGWNVSVSGGTGGWAALGSDAAPRGRTATYIDAEHFSLNFDSRTAGPYSGQKVLIMHASSSGAVYPYATNVESWSPTSTVTGDPYFQINVPGCPNPDHEAECSMAFRNPEVDKYPGNNRTITSFVVSSGVATVTLSSAFPAGTGKGFDLKPGASVWIRNVADPAGSWTHTITAPTGSSGAAANHLVKYVSGADTITALGKDRGGAAGICQSGCEAGAIATVADFGRATCAFDNATTAGNWVIPSLYDDRCHDAGPNFPLFAQPVGVVQDSGAAGDHVVWLNGLNRAFKVQTTNGPGNGTGVTQFTINVPGYPNGSYPSQLLPGYGTRPGPKSAFAGTNLTVSPYVVFQSQTGAGYYYPNGLLRAMARDHTGWSPTETNRVSSWVRFGKNIDRCGYESSSEVGTYDVPPLYTNLSGHSYHQFDMPAYDSQWAKVEWINVPTHREGANDTSYNYPSDMGVVGHPFGWHGARPYFDGLATFYYDFMGLGCSSRDATGQVVTYGPLYYDNVPDEPDELVNTRTGVWSPARFQAGDKQYHPTGTEGFDLSWFGPRQMVVEYEVRYSTAGSMKTLGFSSGVCQNGTTTCSAADRVSTNGSTGLVSYQSTRMAAPRDIWWAIKPVAVPVASTTGSGRNPTWIVTKVSPGVAAGDRVNVSGVAGNTAANQTGIAVAAVKPWQTWMRSDPVPQARGGIGWFNADGAVGVSYTNHGYQTGQTIRISGMSSGALSGLYTITVIDANSFRLDETNYPAVCPCTGGVMRLWLPGELTSITSDGASCSVNLSVEHHILPGWKVSVFGSPSTALTPGTAPIEFTVASTPTATSFQFACGVPPGTYESETAYGGFGVQSWPAFALNVTGNGAYAGGGSISSLEDRKGFAELYLPAGGPTPPSAFPHRPGGRPVTKAGILFYRAPDAGACTTTIAGTSFPGEGGARWRTQVVTGLPAGDLSAYTVSCTNGSEVASGTLATPASVAATPVQVAIKATAPAGSGVDHLVVEYGDTPGALASSVSVACPAGGRCEASFTRPGNTVVWVRRRWCTNRASDAACSNPAHEVARSKPEALTVLP